MIERLIAKQDEFFNSQATQDINFRIKHLKKLKSVIKNREDEIVEALYRDFKKPEFETLSSEIGVVMEELNLHIRKLKSWAKPKSVLPHLANFISFDKIYREAFGRVLIISPWNYPFNLAITPLIGAISAGNTVVLKPSEYSPATSAVIKKILSEVFPTEYVAVVKGEAKIARQLLEHQWDFIFFTGSPSIGKYVYKAAAEHLTPVVLELGGKSPAIIDDTANMRITARRLVWGKFLNAGQTCIAPDYVLITENKLDEFINEMKSEIRKAYGENPKNSKDYARIINKRNFERLIKLIENQNVIMGGNYSSDDLYIAPTLVLRPSLDDEIMQYEIFGPLLPVLTFKNQEEIDEILSKNPNPLAFYIFSTDKKFQKNLIDKYSFGGGVINDVLAHFVNPRLPFGGVGNSGMGNYHGKYSFLTFSRPKPVVKRRFFPDLFVRYLPSNDWKKKIIRFVFGI